MLRVRWFPFRGLLAPILALIALLPVTPATRAAATLEDFGYRARDVRGIQPVLVILGRFPGIGFDNYDTNFWANFLFSPGSNSGLAAYYSDISSGQFQFANAGVVQVEMAADQQISDLQALVEAADSDVEPATLFSSNFVYNAMISGQVDFDALDQNSDGTITTRELLVLIVHNDGGRAGGAVRGGATVTAPGYQTSYTGRVALMGDRTPATTFAHEIAHLWGAYDLYGVWGTDQDINVRLTLMSAAPEFVELDSWHKLQFGWITPEIREVSLPGNPSIDRATLTAVQIAGPQSSLILYDPTLGTEEYYLLEYRTRSSSGTNRFEIGLPDDGLALWQVHQKNARDLQQVGEVVHPNAEPDWRECRLCEGLVHGSLGTAPCPSTNGTHQINDRTEYRVRRNDPAEREERNWRRCSKCGGLVFGPNESISVCPAGGSHDGSASGNYSLLKDQPDLVGHNNWRRCLKCQALYFRGRRDENQMQFSVCPADDRIHETDSSTYTLITRYAHWTMTAVGAPDHLLGGNQLWHSNTTTRLLSGYTDAFTPFRVHVHPFGADSDSITVGWAAAAGPWVEFDHRNASENGTYRFPFDLLAEAQAAAPRNATVLVKAGSTTETLRLHKPARYQSFRGFVWIGK